MTWALVGFLVRRGIFSPGWTKRFWGGDITCRLTWPSELVDDTGLSDEEVVGAWAVEAAGSAPEVPLCELAGEELAEFDVAEAVGVIEEVKPALEAALEGPVAELLVVGGLLSVGWVEVAVAEVRRNAANFIRLEIRLVGETFVSFSGLLSMLKLLILEKD